jgi:hypothetical protein
MPEARGMSNNAARPRPARRWRGKPLGGRVRPLAVRYRDGRSMARKTPKSRSVYRLRAARRPKAAAQGHGLEAERSWRKAQQASRAHCHARRLRFTAKSRVAIPGASMKAVPARMPASHDPERDRARRDMARPEEAKEKSEARLKPRR